MARIRSIKPEYWKSRSIARLSWPARLMFIALWSYVDDNGVGLLDERLIAGELLAQEDDPVEARRVVRETLAQLARESRVTCYTVAGKDFIAITGWDEHQRIDRPNKARYPQPTEAGAVIHTAPEPVTCDDAPEPSEFDEPSRNPRATLAHVQRLEQGNRGTGEQGIPPSAGDAVAAPTAQTLVAEWIDACGDRPPGQLIAQVSKQLKTMLDEGIPYPDVRRGLAAWQAKGIHPSSLPSVVHETRTRSPRLSTGEQRAAEALQLANLFAEQEAG